MRKERDRKNRSGRKNRKDKKDKEERYSRAVGGNNYSYRLDRWIFNEEVARKRLCKQFDVKSFKGYGIERMGAGITAAGAILHYLDYTGHKNIAHINSISRIDGDGYVWIDPRTSRSTQYAQRD